MSPQTVESLAARLSAQTSALHHVAAFADRAAHASQSPSSWGIQPGGTVIAPWSIAQTQSAATQVRAAVESIDALAGRLLSEAAEQRDASVTDRTPAPLLPASPDGATITPVATGPDGAPLPAWLTHPAWDAANTTLDYTVEPAGMTLWYQNPPRAWVFARQQWVNRGNGYYRYRTGLLQWGNSTYKNNPVALVRRDIAAPAWATAAGRSLPRWATVGVKGLGPVGTAVTAVTSGVDAYQQQWDESSGLSDDDRRLRAGAAAATVGGATAAGAWGGAVAGAQVGALVGSIFPGPGTAIGAVAGGIIGGIIGSGAGNAIGNFFNDLW